MKKPWGEYPTPPLTQHFNTGTFQEVNPPFPNWEKSFISGPDSTLFRVNYYEDTSDKNRMWAVSTFTSAAEGPPGHVHGGALSALLDECLGTIVWRKGYPGVTQNLDLHYVLSVPLQLKAIIPLTITEVQDRKIFVIGEIFNDDGKLYVQSKAKFHRLTPDDLDRFRKLKTIA